MARRGDRQDAGETEVSMTQPRKMIPYTMTVAQEMTNRVVQVMASHGLIDAGLSQDEEAFGDQAMHVLESHGMMNAQGNLIAGRCVLLSGQESSFSLLLVSPCPADEFDDDLVRKPSPVQFKRAESGEIVLPARWLITKLEELAANTAAPEALRTLALNLSRRANISDMVLPPEMETVAITVNNADGIETVFEALPGGFTLDLSLVRRPEP